MNRTGKPRNARTRMISRSLKRLGAALFQATLPVRCFQCDRLYDPGARMNPDVADLGRGFAGCLCPVCRSDFRPIQSPLCPRCGIPFAGRYGTDHLCGACEKEPPHFEKARSTGAYQGALRCLIHWLKYRTHVQVAQPLGGLLWETFLRHWRPEEIDLIVPVPLHRGRLRERGFNQAHQLIRKWPALAARTGFDRIAQRLGPELLRRCRPTIPQTGLDRTQRKTNLAQAIAVADGVRLAGQNVLLVDDVLTTGTTADQCAAVLLSAGARAVHVLTLARTV